MRNFFCLLLQLASIYSVAQLDSIFANNKIKYDFDYDAGFYLIGIDQPFRNLEDSYHVPNDIQLNRLGRSFGDYSLYPRDSRPYFHGASYFIFRNKITVSDYINLHAEVYMDHVNSSYGNYAPQLANAFVLPRFEFNRKVKLFREDSADIRLNYGFLRNHSFFERLNIHNWESLGGEAYFDFKKLTLGYSFLSSQYSLQLDNPNQLFIGFNPENKILEASIKAGVHFDMGEDWNFYGYDFGGNIKLKKQPIKFYAQVSNNGRNHGDLFVDFKNKIAGILGSHYRSWKKNRIIEARLEYRNYRAGYNSFRDDGEFNEIVPLYFIDKPLSKWELYTEYGNNGVFGRRSVQSLSSLVYAEQKVYKKVRVFSEVDANYLFEENIDNHMYFLFRCGFITRIKDINTISVGLTNRMIDAYEMYYPVLYQMNRPRFELKLIRKLNPSDW